MDRKTFLQSLGLGTLMAGAAGLSALEKIADRTGRTDRMPVLFLRHGSPMNASEENEFVRGFRAEASRLPEPKAILCVSAHWYTRGTKVTAMDMPRTIHDFGGFPQELYQVSYPAPGSPSLAGTTAELLSPLLVEQDHSWGLDHGAWSVIKHLYPQANVPVIQMSIDYTRDALYHYELAGRLSALREKGILIIGSGNIVHNLGLVDWANLDRTGYGYDWAMEAREKINNWVTEGDFNSLIRYREQGKAINLAVPSPDHFLPLVYTLGLKKGGEQVSLFNDVLLAGSLSMTSVRVG